MAPRTKPADVPDFDPAELVQARFTNVQAVYVPGEGVVGYGDPITVTAEQLAHDSRFIPWSDDWTPDPAAVAAATLEG